MVALVFAVLTSALPEGSLAPPLRQLVGFARAADVRPGEKRGVPVALTPLALCRVDSGGNQWTEPSSWRLDVTVDGVAMMRATLEVTGERRQVLSWPTEWE